MKKALLFSALVAALASCTTAYKNAQTPDDVYYSPAKELTIQDEVRKEEKSRPYSRREERYYDTEEREIRMCAYDRRWRDMNDYYDYDYRYRKSYDTYYSYGYNNCSCGYNYSPYYYGYNYGYYYNPYYYPYPVYNYGYPVVISPKNTTPRMTNLGAYNNQVTTVVNPKGNTPTQTVTRTRVYNNSNDGYDRVRESTRTRSSNSEVYYPSRSTESPNRTYSPPSNSNSSSSSSGSSSSSSSSSSSGTSVSRPGRY